MAPSLFNASRLPASRTLPAPSGCLGNVQANVQRRSISARAHNPVRLAVVDALSPASAQVHSSSSDEEDSAHSGRILVASEPSNSSSQVSEAAAAAAAAAATTLEASRSLSVSQCSQQAAAGPAAAAAAAETAAGPPTNNTVAATTSSTSTPTPTTSAPTSTTTHAHACSSSSSAANHIHNTSEADTSSVAAESGALPTGRDHNSVTIKENTNVKDAAGAVVKVLSRLPNVLVTALRMEHCHDSLNRAVKSIAVARKYVTDEQPDRELTFLPVNRSSPTSGCTDPNLFAFLCFKIQLAKGIQLLEQDKTDLNVSRGSNANAMANAIIRILKERGQAVMKAGGSEAIFIAMSAIINARFRLKRSHNMDAMVVPAWITEDTCSTLGRESKFLRLNILPCQINGPFDSIPA